MKHLLLLLFLLSNGGLLLGQEAFDIKNYQVAITVDESGQIAIDEILDVFFKERRRGIIRDIPYVYTINGDRYTTDISNISIEGHKFQVSTNKGKKNIRIGDPEIFLTGDERYKIHYDVSGAVVRYDDHDEFYWNVIGHESNVGTDIASFSIKFPASWGDSLTNFKAFTGAMGGTASDLYLTKNGSQFSAATTTPLEAYEGVTFAVQIPKGLVSSSFRPLSSANSSSSISGRSASSNVLSKWGRWLVGLPIAVGLFLLSLWQKVSTKTKEDKDAPLVYYPPEGFNPAEVGTFDDYTTHTRDVISLLPYWGDRGVITIKPLEGSEGDMYFTKKGELPADSLGYEHYFFDRLFEDGNVVLLSDLKEKFYETMSTTSSKIKSAVLDRPLYDPEYKKTFHNNWIIAAGIFCVLSAIPLMLIFNAFIAGAGMIIIGITLFVIRAKEPPVSERGKLIKNNLSGLKKWLADPEPVKLDQLMKEDPNYLFRMFPYAIAFGLDKSWQKSMDTMNIDPPIWYDTSAIHMSTGGYTMGRMVSDFQPREIAQVFTSTPPPSNNSSGGSFSGGGGFSGGGAGGGGVSSW